jgi:hypothetical protein
MSNYGMYDLTGIRDDEPHPNPRVWDKTRQCWSDEWKEQLFENEIQWYQQKYD